MVLPRFEPRQEQLIRARRASELGLVRMLEPENFTVAGLLPLLQQLERQPKPLDNLPVGMLDGMDVLCDRVVSLLGEREQRPPARLHRALS